MVGCHWGKHCLNIEPFGTNLSEILLSRVFGTVPSPAYLVACVRLQYVQYELQAAQIHNLLTKLITNCQSTQCQEQLAEHPSVLTVNWKCMFWTKWMPAIAWCFQLQRPFATEIQVVYIAAFSKSHNKYVNTAIGTEFQMLIMYEAQVKGLTLVLQNLII